MVAVDRLANPGVLALATPDSGSPADRRRQARVPGGAVVLQDVAARTGGLAGPGVAGAHDRHRVRGPGRVLCDIGSYTRLVDRGWAIYRYTKLDVHGERDGSSRS